MLKLDSRKEKRVAKLKKAVRHLKKIDDATSQLIETVGECKFEKIGTPYYVLIRSVISQQLSLAAANSILSKVNQTFKAKKIPHPKTFQKASAEKLKQCGISFAKVETVKRIAIAYENKEISDDFLHSLSDKDVMRILCNFKGVGPWTSEMTLIFGLDRWDHFSIGDLGLRKGIEKWYGIPRDDKKKMQEFTEKFSPYRSILSWYLWASFDTEPWE